MTLYKYVVPSSFTEAEIIKDEVLELVESKYSPETVSDFIFCFHEMLNNAIEHGNCNDASKNVIINLQLEDEILKFTVTDQGVGFDWRNACAQEVDLLSERERGRGIYMSKMMTDKIKYNEKGNQVTCEKKV